MIINDLDGYYIVFDTKNWNTELDTLFINFVIVIVIKIITTFALESFRVSNSVKVNL